MVEKIRVKNAFHLIMMSWKIQIMGWWLVVFYFLWFSMFSLALFVGFFSLELIFVLSLSERRVVWGALYEQLAETSFAFGYSDRAVPREDFSKMLVLGS